MKHAVAKTAYGLKELRQSIGADTAGLCAERLNVTLQPDMSWVALGPLPFAYNGCCSCLQRPTSNVENSGYGASSRATVSVVPRAAITVLVGDKINDKPLGGISR